MPLQGFAERLRAARAAASFTQPQVSSALGYTTDTIANYERGRTEPDLADVARMARLYRVSCDWLLAGTPRLPHRFERDEPATCEHGDRITLTRGDDE